MLLYLIILLKDMLMTMQANGVRKSVTVNSKSSVVYFLGHPD